MFILFLITNPFKTCLLGHAWYEYDECRPTFGVTVLSCPFSNIGDVLERQVLSLMGLAGGHYR